MMFKIIIYKREESMFLGDWTEKTVEVKKTKSFIEAKKLFDEKWFELVEFYKGRAKTNGWWIRIDESDYTIEMPGFKYRLDLIID